MTTLQITAATDEARKEHFDFLAFHLKPLIAGFRLACRLHEITFLGLGVEFDDDSEAPEWVEQGREIEFAIGAALGKAMVNYEVSVEEMSEWLAATFNVTDAEIADLDLPGWVEIVSRDASETH